MFSEIELKGVAYPATLHFHDVEWDTMQQVL